ncbi:MAG TPA: response regulator, partial [Lentibacillus sp.]|nr:response regulator [Lentibacillus sp.]
MIHVLIVEDDPMVAKFNRVFLEKVSGFTVAGEVNDTSTAWTF